MPSEFYTAYTKAFSEAALAARAEQASNYSSIDLTMERNLTEGYRAGMAYAFELLTGYEPDPDLFEDTCDNAFCDGECNQNFCEARTDESEVN